MVDDDTRGIVAIPWLDYVAMGGQSHVFGRSEWVVKVPRWSWQSALGRVLVHPMTPVSAMGVLGGLMEPFVVVERIRFSGPQVRRGRPMAGTHQPWSARWAVAMRRLPPEGFLHRRVARATAEEAADLIDSLLATLAAIRARGWHVLDCIMSNFFVDADGQVRLVDAGLLIPISHLRGPSQQVCSRVFVRRMIPDFAAVLREVADVRPSAAAGQARLDAVVASLRPRLTDWRAGRVEVPAARAHPRSVALPPKLREEIITCLSPVYRNLPLTPHPPSGYTPPHHAIPSEN